MLLLAVLASGRIVRKTFNVANTQSEKVLGIMKRLNEGLTTFDITGLPKWS